MSESRHCECRDSDDEDSAIACKNCGGTVEILGTLMRELHRGTLANAQTLKSMEALMDEKRSEWTAEEAHASGLERTVRTLGKLEASLWYMP